MTFDPARPRYTLPLAGTEYELLGTLELVEAVEHALQQGIVQIAVRTPDMGVTDTAKLLAAMLTASGHKMTARQVGELLLNTVGINCHGFTLVRLHAYAFLRVALEPPETRKKVADEMGELLGGETARFASPGKRTKSSASAR